MKEKMIMDLISGTNGRFFSATFVKADGSLRKMNCRIGVKKYTRGGGLKYNAKERGNVIVYDVVNKGYRTIPVRRIKQVKIDGMTIS